MLQAPTTQLAKMSIDPNSSNSRLTSLQYFFKILQMLEVYSEYEAY